MPMRGIVAKITTVISQPMLKAIANPEMNMPTVIRTVAFFSPRHPWYAKQSVANWDASWDWSMVSNHPTYCRSKDLKYAFLQAIDWRSPAIVQQAIISQPKTSTPPPIPKNTYIIYLAFSTIGSPPLAKVSVIWPHRKSKTGIAAPMDNAAKEPTKINIMSILVVKRKS